MKAKKKGMPYVQFRPLIHRAKADAARRGATVIPGDVRVCLELFRIDSGVYHAFERGELTDGQNALLDAEYIAAYAASRLHHVRQRNRMEA